MLVSHAHKFIFVHVYKTGGTSVTAAFRPYARSPLDRALDRLPAFRGKTRLSRALRGINSKWDPEPLAAHSTALEIRKALPAYFDEYLTFAFVRNPWDWQVSLYTYMLRNEDHYSHALIASMRDFDEYIRWRCTHAAKPQSGFVCDADGNVIVDRLCRFERISEEIDAVSQELGIRVKLPRLNVSNTRPYREFYTPATRELVAQTFAEDVERFGYRF